MRAYKILPVEIKVKDFRLSKTALKRLEWMDWYFSHGKNAEATCRHFSISKSVFYRWLPRFNPNNLSTLEFNTKLCTPHHLREMTTPAWILKRVYDIRLDDLEKSKYEIHEELLREGVKISHKVIQKVINRHIELKNTQHKATLKKHRNYSIARIKAAYELKDKGLGSLVQIDTKYLYVLGRRFYLFVAIDCKSRYAFIWAYGSCNSTNAANFLTQVIDYFPFHISAINTDNGPEYLLNFHKRCEELGIPHYFNTPHTPTMNSRAERLIQTAEYEFFNYQADLMPNLKDINLKCILFNDKYNNRRFHQAIHYKTPSEYVTNYQELQKGEMYVIYPS
ncbi:MAG: DDE-type integrase/transposase/recombinase [Candidatus Daviesbacteria bacterium]|nr:DDE-type integrase/transposase/recombinase [Candidatus Daviesbacteria bacterium]